MLIYLLLPFYVLNIRECILAIDVSEVFDSGISKVFEKLGIEIF